MKFTIKATPTELAANPDASGNVANLDPAALSVELITALGSNFGISTAGIEITTNCKPDGEPDEAAFQAVLDAHILNATKRNANKALDKQIAELEAANPITHRALREFMLGSLLAAGIDPTANPATNRVLTVETAAALLRSKRK